MNKCIHGKLFLIHPRLCAHGGFVEEGAVEGYLGHHPFANVGMVGKVGAVAGLQDDAVVFAFAVAEVVQRGQRGEEPIGIDHVGHVLTVDGDILADNQPPAMAAFHPAADHAAEQTGIYAGTHGLTPR